MGFLDNKGLKKVVNWVKDYVKNNSVDEGDIQDKQTLWRAQVSSSEYIEPYVINELYRPGLSIMFVGIDEANKLPLLYMEYKIVGSGHILNYTSFPSTFDMPWPNNEIPKWISDHEYEIYIAGGRVVSVDDITPPVEEVSYTIEANEDCTFKLNGGTNWLYKLNNDDWNEIPARVYLNLPVGENVIYIKNIGTNQGLGDINYVEITNYNNLKVDCSKTKSNNLHNVLGNLKVDEIIYPQACFGDIDSPIYEFEAPEVNLYCLENNWLFNPFFNFKTNNFKGFNYSGINNDGAPMFGKNLSNIDINKIILNINKHFYYGNFSYYGEIQTLGTLGLGVSYTGYNQTNMLRVRYFANIVTNITKISNTYYSNIFDLPKELKIGNENGEPLILKIKIKDKNYSQIILVSNLDFENSTFINENSETVRVYTYSDIPEGYNVDGFEFIKVNSVEEVPFQYAPLDWDDVKNYDDEGNVIE